MEQKESELIEEAKRDPKNFKPLYDLYFKRIYLFIYHRVGDKEDAADITSEVFLKALTKIENFVFRGLPLSSWLYRIAINECNHYFRKTKKELLVVLDEKTIDHLADEIGCETIELRIQHLEKIIQKLRDEDIQLIQLRFFEGLQYKDIGDIMGITENNAKVKSYRVMNKIKLQIGVQ